MSDTTMSKPFVKSNRPNVQAPPSGAAPGTAILPPAGHARKEELKKRTDILEAKAAHDFANVEAIDPDAIEIERELAQHFNELNVANAEPGFVYKWVNYTSNGGIAIRQAIAPPERWQVVTGDMPEATDLKASDGTRKLGDVMLVRMPKKRYDILERLRAEKNARQQQGHESNLRELARRNPKAVKVYGSEDMPESVTKRLTNPSQASINAMRGAEAAQAQFEQNLRAGLVDGLQ